MTLSTVRTGFSYLLSGDFEKIVMGIKNKLDARLPLSFQFICEDDAPAWLHTSHGVRTFHITESNYVSLLSSARRTKFTVDSEVPVQAVEVPIVALDEATSVHLSRSLDGGDDSATEFRIQIDSSFDYPPVLWRRIPVRSTDATPQFQINVSRSDSLVRRLRSAFPRHRDTMRPAKTSVGLPAVVPTEPQPPVFLISIDAVRYDLQDELRPVVDELGENAVVPTEPRTQGTWTPPSHASMFSGVHPGRHGYVGYGNGPGDKRPIDPQLTTIPKLLADNGYKNSALVSHSRILPEFGFGRGFHRFRHDPMSYTDWVTRRNDARESVNQLINWIDTDLAVRDHSLFYFLHVFDPHYPYIPPVERVDSPDIDFSRSKEYRRQMNKSKGDDWTYVDGVRDDYQVDPALVRQMKEWYRNSAGYTGNHVARFLRYLKSRGLFDESLIIITGDHGEEFGERGFFTHTSLYDENIRPFMAYKPPASESWPRADCPDTIDFLPTIAQLVGDPIPDACDGTPIQGGDDGSPRLTERIYPDWYNICVETGGVKGIFTFDSNYPDRPVRQTIEAGPELEEFYEVAAVREGRGDRGTVSPDQQDHLRQLMEEFLLTDDSPTYESQRTAKRPSQETIEHLENLGYK